MDQPDLGERFREFSAASDAKQTITTGIFILVVVGGIGAVALKFTKEEQIVLASCFFGAVVLGCLAYIVSGVLNLKRTLVLHENGMEVRSWNGNYSFRWNEIETIKGALPVLHRGTPIRVGGPMNIQLPAGKVLSLAGHLQ